MQQVNWLIKILLILAVVISFPAIGKLSMTIDRTDISSGETFVLDIRLDEDTDDQPDLSRIPKEFTIVSNSQYHHTQIFNGQRHVIKGWKITLKTLDSGRLTIPPITVGNEQTQEIKLNIKDASNQFDLNGQSKLIYLEANVDRQESYVQQQVIYTVTLYRAVNTHYASLTEPTAENAIVEKLGDDVQFQKHIDNRRYNVTQRKYAIFPQQSGNLEISPVNFTADVNDNSRRSRSSFLSASRPVSITTEALSLKVNPKPDNASDPWLPASDVILADKWSPNTTALKVGEPITWTLLLTVQGLSESQLPEIHIPKVDGLQWYYDTPQKERQVNDKGIVGQRIEKLAVIPSKEGKITIPEITVSWWDVNSNSNKTAVLASKTFDIAAGEAIAQPNVIVPTNLSPTNSVVGGVDPTILRNWQYAALTLLILWLTTLIAYFLKSGRATTGKFSQHHQPEEVILNESVKSIRGSLKANLKAGNYLQTEKLLIQLVNQLGYKSIHSLGTLRKAIAAQEVVKKLRSLEEARYSTGQLAADNQLTEADIDQIIKDLSSPQNAESVQAIPAIYSKQLRQLSSNNPLTRQSQKPS